MPTFTNNVTDENAIEGKSVKGRGLVGSSDTDYGIRGHSKKSAGIRGSSDEGRGVEGWSTSSEGIVGITKTGTGVAGASDTGYGTSGESKKSAGVRGTSVEGRGVEGWSEASYGASGDSRTSAGVRGTSVEGTGTEGWSTNGTGVFATSQNGVAIYGKGGKLAGFFEGDVEVTESLTVKGVSIHALLQRIIQLEEAVSALRARPIDVPTSSTPQIRVTREGSGAGSVFVIEGSGFLPNKTVTIRVADDTLQTRTFPHSSDASGKIGVRQGISCISGLTLHFSATDSRPNSSDITGFFGATPSPLFVPECLTIALTRTANYAALRWQPVMRGVIL